jgi:hypothetical protein
MDGEPRRLEYTNLRCVNTAGIHLQQFHVAQVYTIQSLTDANGQIAMHPPASA